MENQLHERLFHTCTWCLNLISEGEERFAFGVKASDAMDLTEKEGQFVSLRLALQDKTVVALVPTHNSSAKEQGLDLIFLTCSQACAEDLRDALDMERDVFKD